MWPLPGLRCTWQVGVSWQILFEQMGSFLPSPLGGKEAGEAQGSKRFAQGAELEPEPKFALARSGHLGHALCHRPTALQTWRGRAVHPIKHGLGFQIRTLTQPQPLGI